MRPKVCKACGSKFTPIRSIQPTCDNFSCKYEYAMRTIAKAKDAKAKREAKAHREAKVKAKPLKYWLDLAQTWVNKYVRLRDSELPCISCGTTSPIQYAAGHYRTRGAASHLRFNHDNLHKQCNKRCNLELSGNLANYRNGLIEKIGIERVLALENDNTTHKWTIDEAKDVIEQHKKLVKELHKTLDTQ